MEPTMLSSYRITYLLLWKISLSEQNIASILVSIEELYRGHRRNGGI